MADETKATVPVIDRVIELQPARILEVDGFSHIDKDKSVTMFRPPLATTLEVHTLSGFVGLLENDAEAFSSTLFPNVAVQVEAYDEVALVATDSDKFGRRFKPVLAKALKPERAFAFNQYMPQEEFVIALSSLFVQTVNLLALTQIAGNLAKETEIRQEDDGFTQRVTTKDGVVRLKEITVKPRITLQPFRTFLEVDQPEGEYIFRVRHDERVGNLCALFEADGGLWKLKAMDIVKEWLKNRLGGSENVIVNGLKVIA